ncbi:hypothetical protein IMG5_176650 [Ichthyophthirius multifiliis]|uniref:Transmembrane protein n=1 Tax=Ichthyophthirius multifiliis TaxID=5932 RepID=G0R2B8_ICHMU|nr:hypothetical protein IMG5_176650 [Ichthyophthirius multifiliis]EGR28387.1 hypothetical protein IMG5_176650 [Ichthyophthirius multifiliis]|eukprot:XP_004027732.1 hypothetical protein IMG5_176650 [Ichthyophthirius multifiliis]
MTVGIVKQIFLLCKKWVIGGVFILQFIFFYFNTFFQFLSQCIRHILQQQKLPSQFCNFFFLLNYYKQFFQIYKNSLDEKNNLKLIEQNQKYIKLKNLIKQLKFNIPIYPLSFIQKIMISYKYYYIITKIILDIIQVSFGFYNTYMYIINLIFELFFGVLMICEFYINVQKQIILLKISKNHINQNQYKKHKMKQNKFRIMIKDLKLVIPFICGVCGFLIDLIFYILNEYSLDKGSSIRLLILLTTSECKFAFKKFLIVLNKIYDIGFINLSLMYILSIIAFYTLNDIQNQFQFFFVDITYSFLFVVQTITFDAWGDIARAALLKVKFFIHSNINFIFIQECWIFYIFRIYNYFCRIFFIKFISWYYCDYSIACY